jgi:hypothetical protein
MRHLAEFSQIYEKEPSCNELKPFTLIEVFAIATKTFAMTHRNLAKGSVNNSKMMEGST